MLIYLIALLVSLYTLSLFNNGKRSEGLFVLLLCAISWFEPNLGLIGLDGLTMRMIGENASLISVILLLLFKKKSYESIGKKSYKTLSVLVLILIAYSVFRGFSTIITGKESLFNVIALLKPSFILLSLFVIRDINKEDCINALAKLVKLTTMIGVIAFLQVIVGFNLFGNTILEYDEGVDRFWSPYTVAAFCCMYTLVINSSKKYTFLFFLLLVILPLRRGILISVLLSIVIFFMFEIRHNKMPKGVFVVALAGLLALPFLASRFSSQTDNASSDIRAVMSGKIDYANFRNGVTGGSFLFRVAILAERIDYLANRGSELYTGVGLIHERTAQKKFNFSLGVFTRVNGERIPQQIDTVDIVWAPMIMRLGLIGVFLYLLLFGYMLWFFIKNAKISRWSILGAMYVFCALTNSVADNQLVSYFSIFLYFILFKMVVAEKRYLQRERVQG